MPTARNMRSKLSFFAFVTCLLRLSLLPLVRNCRVRLVQRFIHCPEERRIKPPVVHLIVFPVGAPSRAISAIRCTLSFGWSLLFLCLLLVSFIPLNSQAKKTYRLCVKARRASCSRSTGPG